jgi:hypothetical protein
MSSSRNQELNAITTELDAAGLRYEISGGGHRHFKIRWVAPDGKPRTVTAASSSSDTNARWFARAKTRRILRAGGVL